MKFPPPSGLLPGGRCIDHGDPAATSAEKKVATFRRGGGGKQRSPWPGGCELIRGHTVRPPPFLTVEEHP